MRQHIGEEWDDLYQRVIDTACREMAQKTCIKQLTHLDSKDLTERYIASAG